jgi:hypothetical protein
MAKSRKSLSAKPASPADSRKADALNPNRGTPGQNKTRAKAQGNRGKQLNPNQKS